MINGVIIKDVISHKDVRGFFREIWRLPIDTGADDLRNGKGQLSHSLVKKGVIKAWHGHLRQGQLNYVATGAITVALYDSRDHSSTYKEIMEFKVSYDKPSVYYFPPGVLHGYNCTEEPMNIIYMTSGIYKLEEEIRVSPAELDSIYKW